MTDQIPTGGHFATAPMMIERERKGGREDKTENIYLKQIITKIEDFIYINGSSRA